jgi:hypothetical protein
MQLSSESKSDDLSVGDSTNECDCCSGRFWRTRHEGTSEGGRSSRTRREDESNNAKESDELMRHEPTNRSFAVSFLWISL